jgi:phospholipid/cholesterol/gamma-HCH transport system substrate-binding protein
MDRGQLRIELAVGAFVIVGALALLALSVSIAGARFAPPKRYEVTARFASAGALKERGTVKIAGVDVGRVRSIHLADYQADVKMGIDDGVKLPVDTIASIRTLGILGDSYVLLTPGSSEKDLSNGGVIVQTEPAIDLMDLIEKHAFPGSETTGSGGEGLK